MWSSNSTSGNLSEERKNTASKLYMHLHDPCSIIYTRYGKNQSVHWWIIRLRKCSLYIQQNIQFLYFYVSLRISKFLQLAPQDQSIVKLIFQFSCFVMSDSLQPRGLQHARPPCPSPAPRVYSNLCPLSQWCHPTISSSVVPFSSRLQSFPASGSFQVSQFFVSGAKVLEFQLQHQSFQWIFRTDFP